MSYLSRKGTIFIPVPDILHMNVQLKIRMENVHNLFDFVKEEFEKFFDSELESIIVRKNYKSNYSLVVWIKNRIYDNDLFYSKFAKKFENKLFEFEDIIFLGKIERHSDSFYCDGDYLYKIFLEVL